MQKKLLGMAVAVALAAPGLALAQATGVTIGGIFKVGIDSISIRDAGPARAGLNTRETRITDNASRVIFGITENIGGGLSAVAQLDARFQADDAGGGFAETGNTWVGLRSTNWGTVTFGRHDLHYGKQPDETALRAGALMGAAVSLMDFGNGGGTAIANATRTPNVIRWDSPRWGGFAATAAYSTNHQPLESDLTHGARKGNAWNLNPSFTAPNFQVGWSHWRAKADVPAAVSDQRSNVLYGHFIFGGFRAGLAVNDSKFENGITGATTSERRAWTIPVRWQAGPHHVAGHYTKARSDKVLAGDTSARMWAATYSYSFSKRTSIGATYAQIKNEAQAMYNFFTNGPTQASLGSAMSAPAAGEDPRLIALTVRHAF
jgi:predicted porin